MGNGMNWRIIAFVVAICLLVILVVAASLWAQERRKKAEAGTQRLKVNIGPTDACASPLDGNLAEQAGVAKAGDAAVEEKDAP